MTYDTPEARAKHREEQRRYLEKNPNQQRDHHRRWRAEHPDFKLPPKSRVKHMLACRNWRKAHPTHQREWKKAHPAAVRISKAKIRSAERGLPKTHFVLNSTFPGAHFHHVDPGIGVWIPKDLHMSMNHNLKTGRGMIAINEAVAEWLNKGETA